MAALCMFCVTPPSLHLCSRAHVAVACVKGWQYVAGGDTGDPFGPSGGRFDIGPECQPHRNVSQPGYTGCPGGHHNLWLGSWTCTAVDGLKVRATTCTRPRESAEPKQCERCPFSAPRVGTFCCVVLCFFRLAHAYTKRQPCHAVPHPTPTPPPHHTTLTDIDSTRRYARSSRLSLSKKMTLQDSFLSGLSSSRRTRLT
jgi:hypothetical protein